MKVYVSSKTLRQMAARQEVFVIFDGPAYRDGVMASIPDDVRKLPRWARVVLLPGSDGVHELLVEA